MDLLSESLQLAAADPPPTRIDVDRLIEGERRAGHRRRWVAAGSAAAVLAVSATTFLLVRAPAGGAVVGDSSSQAVTKPDPGGQPERLGQCIAVARPPSTEPESSAAYGPIKPAPTETRDAAVPRLSRVLNDSLRQNLPGASFADERHPNCEAVQFQPDAHGFLYAAEFVAKDTAGPGQVVVGLRRATWESRAAFESGESTLYEDRETRPDGTMVGWIEGARLGDGSRHQVDVLRPDGTFVMLVAQTTSGGSDLNPTRPTPAATVEQLIAIGTEPNLTLYP